jgi:hypothetical protein
MQALWLVLKFFHSLHKQLQHMCPPPYGNEVMCPPIMFSETAKQLIHPRNTSLVPKLLKSLSNFPLAHIHVSHLTQCSLHVKIL